VPCTKWFGRGYFVTVGKFPCGNQLQLRRWCLQLRWSDNDKTSS
jgi:hypothetical protein